jgi:hypothetical protein
MIFNSIYWTTSDGESSGNNVGPSSSPSSSSPPMPLPRSGPMGIPGPAELTDWLASLREIVSTAGPQLRAILNRPGAQELLANVQWGLLQRFAARSVKFVMGWQGGEIHFILFGSLDVHSGPCCCYYCICCCIPISNIIFFCIAIYVLL